MSPAAAALPSSIPPTCVAGPRVPADPNDPAGQRPLMAHIHLLFINALESVWEVSPSSSGDSAMGVRLI
jgi:hypothetical protein